MTGRRQNVFTDVTPRAVRKHLSAVFEGLRTGASREYSRVAILRAGAFNVARAAIRGGYKADRIGCYGASLQEAVVGFTLAGLNLQGLDVKVLDAEIAEALGTDTPHSGAKILYALKVAETNPENLYQRAARTELLGSPRQYIDQMRGKLKGLKEDIGGIEFKPMGMLWAAHHQEFGADTIVYINPPRTAAEHRKALRLSESIQWEAPQYTLWDPAEHTGPLWSRCLDADWLALLFLQTWPPEGTSAFTVFAKHHVRRGGRYDVLLANRPDEVSEAVDRVGLPDRRIQTEPIDYPILPNDHRITGDSSIRFVRIREKHALYYRDLFAHKLGNTVAEVYFAMLIDGYLTSVSGHHLGFWTLGAQEASYETFGFSCRPPLYPRINKLHMRCLTSEVFRQTIIRTRPSVITPLRYFRTTCLAEYPEQKGNRGILKVVSREQLPDGTYHLQYETEFHQEDLSGALRWFFDREGYNAETGLQEDS